MQIRDAEQAVEKRFQDSLVKEDKEFLSNLFIQLTEFAYNDGFKDGKSQPS